MLVYYSPQTEGLGLIKLDQVIKLLLKIHAILPFRFISESFRIENRRDHPVHVWVYIYIYIDTWICIKANAFLPEYEMKRRAIRAVT